MLNSRQRAYLRGLGNQIDPIIQIGKSGVTDAVIDQIDEALEARELIKITILKNAGDDTDSIAEEVAEATGADIVQKIGCRFLIYKRSSEKPVIELPD